MNGTAAIATKIKDQTRQIDEYVRLFSSNHGRKPMTDEIPSALQTKLDDDIFLKIFVLFFFSVGVIWRLMRRRIVWYKGNHMKNNKIYKIIEFYKMNALYLLQEPPKK